MRNIYLRPGNAASIQPDAAYPNAAISWVQSGVGGIATCLPGSPPPTTTPTELVKNGTFYDSLGNLTFANWLDLKGYWKRGLHPKRSIWVYQGGLLQMDIDMIPGSNPPQPTLISWPVILTTDTCSTILTPTANYTSLILSWLEVHHLYKGTIECWVDGISGGVAEMLFYKNGPFSPFVIDKTLPPIPVRFDIPLPTGKTFDQFILYFRGTMLDARDAWVGGNISVLGVV